jgi:hypothetical protein
MVLKTTSLFIIFGILGPSSSISKEDLIQEEDIYLSSIDSSLLFNFLLKAYTSLGYIHSPEALAKIKEAASFLGGRIANIRLTRDSGTLYKNRWLIQLLGKNSS